VPCPRAALYDREGHVLSRCRVRQRVSPPRVIISSPRFPNARNTGCDRSEEVRPASKSRSYTRIGNPFEFAPRFLGG